MQCFIELGFKKSSIDEIAVRANVGKGTVYLACESKADLFYRAVHADLQAWAAQIARFVDPRQSAEQILRKMAETGVIYLGDHPLVRGLFAGVHEGMMPDWAERFSELRAMGRSTVADVEGLDEETSRKVDFYTRQFVDALSPSNFVMTNPEVLRATIESRGEHPQAVAGSRRTPDYRRNDP